MDPKKPIPTAPQKIGGQADAQAVPAPEPQEKSGGMASEGGASGGGAGSPAEDAREGGMIGEG
jgi:hypothetical protein